MQTYDIGLTHSQDEIAALCRRWKIRELALFGSALREGFGPSSDLDILVTFAGDANWGLLDHVQMQREFERVLRRDVDLISRQPVSNNIGGEIAKNSRESAQSAASAFYR